MQVSFCKIPDTISTDITRRSAYKRGGRYGLPMCMSMARAVGMKEEDILRGVTTNAAKALKLVQVAGEDYVLKAGDIFLSIFSFSENRREGW